MRRTFADELYKHMEKDSDIWLLTADLGYKVWDQICADHATRAMNVGASEQAMLDIAVGLALEGKKPFCYSITPFLLYRAYETLRTYVNHENIPVRLVGSGRNDDYKHDGISHFSHDASQILATLPNITPLWPDTKEQVPDMVNSMVTNSRPWFISLRK